MSDNVVESGPAPVLKEGETYFNNLKHQSTRLTIATHSAKPTLKQVLEEKHISLKNFLKKDWDELDSRNPLYIKYLQNYVEKTGIQHKL